MRIGFEAPFPCADLESRYGPRHVIVASRLGKGIVIRPGLPEFSASLRRNAELAGFLERVWTLLVSP